MPASRPTLPSNAHPRRLGVGGGPGGGDRVVRAQLIIALVLGFTVLAVLLYLLRRPGSSSPGEHDAAAGPSASTAAPASQIVRTKIEPAKPPPEKVKVGAPQHVKCGASPRLTGGNLCDSLPFFEQGLAQAIAESADCAPAEREEGSINYVLAVDFRNHDVHLYPGKSGTWRGKQAKKSVECVRRALKAPTWDTLVHQYRYYVIAVLATYPPRLGVDGLPDFK